MRLGPRTEAADCAVAHLEDGPDPGPRLVSLRMNYCSHAGRTFSISPSAFGFMRLWDGRTDEFFKIGRQYGTEPGFYLIVGPNWTGDPFSSCGGVSGDSHTLRSRA